jgi:hypothetical protein
MAHTRIALALGLVLAIGLLAGCGSSKSAESTTVKPSGQTAKEAFKVAMSTLSTAAPDGKLLVCQTVEPITATSTPIWEYLVGSPKTDVVYAVVVTSGKGEFQEYSQAGLTAEEWKLVPSMDAWKIDSPAAVSAAIGVYPQGKTAAYVPGFVTYVPKSAETSKIKQMKWIINFDPASKGSASTSTVEVDMSTGVAELAK